MHLPAASAALLALAGTTVWASPVTIVSTRSLAVDPPAAPFVEARTLGLLGSLFCRRTFWGGCTPAPKPDPHGCKSSEFWWDKKSQCCTTGGNPSPPSCPSHASCPNGWYWSPDGYCKPSTPSDCTNNTPTCSKSGHFWLPDLFYCAAPSYPAPSTGICSSISFLWSPFGSSVSFCVLTGYQWPSLPPSGKNCPSKWGWDDFNGCCAPSKPSDCPPSTPPTCATGYGWDKPSKCCLPNPTPVPTPDPHGCSSDQFWWTGKGECCTNGGNPSPPSCPPKLSCPKGWYWSSDGYCKPSTPSYGGSPSCSTNGHVWFPDLFCCGTPNFPQSTIGVCAASQFVWFPASASASFCVTIGGGSSYSPPSGKTCPQQHYWDNDNSCCVPSTQSYGYQPTCSSGSWNGSSLCCIVSSWWSWFRWW